MLVVIVLLNCTRKSSFTLLSYLSIPTEIFIEPLKLLLIYTFTGAVTLGNFFSMPISKACSVHKTVVYDFISNQRHNWKKLLLMVATKAIGMVKTEQNEESFSALICDDSNIH